MPSFLKIENILVRERGQHVWFCGEVWTAVNFSEHFHNWLVERASKKINAIDALKLIYHQPLCLLLFVDLKMKLCICLDYTIVYSVYVVFFYGLFLVAYSIFMIPQHSFS